MRRIRPGSPCISHLAGALALVASACGQTAPDPSVLQETITIDQELSAEQQQDVREAVKLWARASGSAFNPETSVGQVECGQPFAIKAIAEEGCGVGHALPEDEHMRVLGLANAEAHTITVVAWLEGTRFRYNVAHELGHYLYVGHGEGLMAQERWGQEPVLTEQTVEELCSVLPCGPNAHSTALATP